MNHVHGRTIKAVINMFRSHHPSICFIITRSYDDVVVLYKHTRLNDILIGPGLISYTTTLSIPTVCDPTTKLMTDAFYGTRNLQQLKRGRYIVQIAAFLERTLTIVLMKNGNVKVLLDIKEQESVLLGIHLHISKSMFGVPTVDSVDIYGSTVDGNKTIEETIHISECIKKDAINRFESNH